MPLILGRFLLATILVVLPLHTAHADYAYITNHDSGTVSIINTATNTVIDTIAFGVQRGCGC